MIKKKYLTKKIWFSDTLWELVKVYSPNKFEDHLLLRGETDCVHKDGSPSWCYVVIEDGNDSWLPDTRKTRKLMKKYLELKNDETSTLNQLEQAIQDMSQEIWSDKPEECKW